MMALLLPDITPLAGHRPEDAEELSRRLSDALRRQDGAGREPEQEEEQPEIDADLTFSSKEILQSIDFENMSDADIDGKRLVEGKRVSVRVDIGGRRIIK